MKITKEDLAGLVAILEQAEEFKPIVKLNLNTLGEYSEEIKSIPEAVSRWLVKNRIASIEQYRDAGFTKDDAILMTLDDSNRIQKASRLYGEVAT